MIICHLQAEPKIFFTTMYILSAITLPVDLFGIYCIIWKSPPIMKDYSRLLLIYQICVTVTDTWTNLMFIPVAFFPFPVVYHAGLLFSRRYLKYSYMFITWLCFMVTTMGAVVQLFAFRWQSLLMSNHPLRLDKKLVYAICVIMFILFNSAVVIAGFTMPNRREELMPTYIQNFSCIGELIDQPGIQYFSLDDYRRLLLVVTIEGIIVAGTSLILVYLTFRSFRFTNVTQKTMELQRKYQKSLVLQVMVPIIVVIVPGCSLMLAGAWSDILLGFSYTEEIQVIGNIFICVLSCHGFFGTIIMVHVNTPYRSFAIESIRRFMCMCTFSAKLDLRRRRKSENQVQDVGLKTSPVNSS
ncbi:7TM chemoreceptor [Trichostrongylus colubriformis]|uniref:7TM chemoreceptor n=1 Tax=Trichostrongylus colubriformis TaxID=6319 RepID=A0AAN8EPG0_TRICO